VIRKVGEGFDNAEFHVPVNAIHQFCVNELSAFYLDASKDRLYAEGAASLERRSGQTAMWHLLSVLSRMLAPIISFTAEEIWQSMRKLAPSLAESVFLTDFPVADESQIDTALDEIWGKALSLRGAISRTLEIARSKGVIGHSLDARVQVEKGESLEELKSAFPQEAMEEIAIVSAFEWTDALADLAVVQTDGETGIRVAADKAEGEKCPRCWKHSTRSNGEGLCPRCVKVLG
jgi:isoleucyl-tRNA synthetase